MGLGPLTGLPLPRPFADLGRALSPQLCPLGVEADGETHLA
ncbi:SUKH-3 domain containing protein, partial [Streptomyces sp. XY533]